MNKGIGLALVILITPLVVITASTLTFYLGYKPTSTSNNGELIVPPLETNLFKLENIKTYPKKYVHFSIFGRKEKSSDDDKK